MKTSTTRMERVIAAAGSVFVFVSFLASVLLDGDPLSILELIPLRFNGHPFTSILLPIVHGTTFLIGISCLIKPGIKRLYILMLVESGVTIITGYEQLGIFFFYAALILIIIGGQFSKKSFFTCYMLLIYHIISIFLMFTHGWPKTFVALFTSVFYGAFFICVYKYLKAEFCIIPANVSDHELFHTTKGKSLSLKTTGLSERQINLVYDYLNENLSYKDLSEKYFISISTVKKEFSSIFHIFKVDNINELKMLLLQFQISK